MNSKKVEQNTIDWEDILSDLDRHMKAYRENFFVATELNPIVFVWSDSSKIPMPNPTVDPNDLETWNNAVSNAEEARSVIIKFEKTLRRIVPPGRVVTAETLARFAKPGVTPEALATALGYSSSVDTSEEYPLQVSLEMAKKLADLWRMKKSLPVLAHFTDKDNGFGTNAGMRMRWNAAHNYMHPITVKGDFRRLSKDDRFAIRLARKMSGKSQQAGTSSDGKPLWTVFLWLRPAQEAFYQAGRQSYVGKHGASKAEKVLEDVEKERKGIVSGSIKPYALVERYEHETVQQRTHASKQIQATGKKAEQTKVISENAPAIPIEGQHGLTPMPLYDGEQERMKIGRPKAGRETPGVSQTPPHSVEGHDLPTLFNALKEDKYKRGQGDSRTLGSGRQIKTGAWNRLFTDAKQGAIEIGGETKSLDAQELEHWDKAAARIAVDQGALHSMSDFDQLNSSVKDKFRKKVLKRLQQNMHQTTIDMHGKEQWFHGTPEMRRDLDAHRKEIEGKKKKKVEEEPETITPLPGGKFSMRIVREQGASRGSPRRSARPPERREEAEQSSAPPEGSRPRFTTRTVSEREEQEERPSRPPLQISPASAPRGEQPRPVQSRTRPSRPAPAARLRPSRERPTPTRAPREPAPSSSAQRERAAATLIDAYQTARKNQEELVAASAEQAYNRELETAKNRFVERVLPARQMAENQRAFRQKRPPKKLTADDVKLSEEENNRILELAERAKFKVLSSQFKPSQNRAIAEAMKTRDKRMTVSQARQILNPEIAKEQQPEYQGIARPSVEPEVEVAETSQQQSPEQIQKLERQIRIAEKAEKTYRDKASRLESQYKEIRELPEAGTEERKAVLAYRQAVGRQRQLAEQIRNLKDELAQLRGEGNPKESEDGETVTRAVSSSAVETVFRRAKDKYLEEIKIYDKKLEEARARSLSMRNHAVEIGKQYGKQSTEHRRAIKKYADALSQFETIVGQRPKRPTRNSVSERIMKQGLQKGGRPSLLMLSTSKSMQNTTNALLKRIDTALARAIV